MALASEARKNSSSPSPTTSGEPLRAPDQHIGIVPCDDGDAERALDLGKRLQNGLHQIALVVFPHELGQHFGIGFGPERDAFLFQLLP